MQFVFVLAMVFLGGGLMEFVGMEGILGAFLAGLVLNRLIPHVSPLMNRLEFVGNALFIPYFLIGVGSVIGKVKLKSNRFIGCGFRNSMQRNKKVCRITMYVQTYYSAVNYLLYYFFSPAYLSRSISLGTFISFYYSLPFV